MKMYGFDLWTDKNIAYLQNFVNFIGKNVHDIKNVVQ